jgi:hypothetical protein
MADDLGGGLNGHRRPCVRRPTVPGNDGAPWVSTTARRATRGRPPLVPSQWRVFVAYVRFVVRPAGVKLHEQQHPVGAYAVLFRWPEHALADMSNEATTSPGSVERSRAHYLRTSPFQSVYVSPP